MKERLWDIKHPYYCSPATWFDRECHARHADATEFLGTFGGSDSDMNYVVRWDWIRKTDDDENVISNDGTFYVFEVRQRKGFFFSHEFPVTEADEPALREWLAKRIKTLLANWRPVIS